MSSGSAMRSLIVVCLAATASLTAAQAASSQGQKVTPPAATPAKTSPSVIVIGAGLAGVAAARDLVDAGVKDVLVLEARDRPGGRLHSVVTKAGPVDLGAMWIHEANPDNPLMQLAKKENIALSPTLDYTQGQPFTSKGEPASLEMFIGTYMDWMSTSEKIDKMREEEKAAIKANKAGPKDVPYSVMHTQYIEMNKGKWKPEQREMADALVAIGAQNLLNANVTKISTLRYGDAKTLPATDVHIKPGFDAIPKKMLPGIRVSYNTQVKSVDQSGNTVTVTLANGTKLTADYVIVTVSLGVLKAGTIRFNPPLPAAKQAAIKDMGMGVLDKVVLVFKDQDVFWDKKADFVVMMPTDLSGRWTAWLSYYRIFNMPVLVALNSADTALDLEAKTDKQVVDEALKALTKAFKNVPTPVETIVTRWANDPLARGSYSYFAVGNPLTITDTLAAPHGRVLFAGEATSKKMATALGALLSGRREAQRILTLAKVAPAAATTKPAQGLATTAGKPAVAAESGAKAAAPKAQG